MECSGVIAKQIIYSGRVHGVGFRYTCKDLARGYDVVGSVRNCVDGTVELIVGGDPAEVDEYLSEIEENSPVAHHIQSRFETPLDVPNLKGFVILNDLGS